MKTNNKLMKSFTILLALVFTISALSPIQVSAADKVALSKTKLTLVKGKSSTLKLKNNQKKVTWSSNKKSIATVNNSGKVTAKKAGTATITAKAGNKKYTCKVTVKNPSKKVQLSKSKVSLQVGKTTTLKVQNTSKKVTWSSNKKSIATVNNNGKVTAKKAGTATITAKVGNKKYTCKVTVTKKKSSSTSNVSNTISVPKSTYEINKSLPKISTYALDLDYGGTAALTVSNTSEAVTWASSNPSVATVDQNGTVTGVYPGNATISVTNSKGSTKCQVAVKTPELRTTDMIALINSTNSLRVTGTVYKPTWTSSNSDIATVTSDGNMIGNVMGIKEGSVTITAHLPGFDLPCEVTASNYFFYMNGSKYLKVGNKSTISAQENNGVPAIQTISWSSSNPAVASVTGDSKEGFITANAVGTAVITATINNSKTVSSTIYVENPQSGKEVHLFPGDTYQASMTGGKVMKYYTDRPDFIAINQNGVVTAKYPSGSYGHAITRTSATARSYTTTSNEEVIVEVPGLLEASMSIPVGYTGTNQVIETIYRKQAKWSIADTSIATVDKNGNVKGKKIGSTTLIAKVHNGQSEYVLTCPVKITKAPTGSKVEMQKKMLKYINEARKKKGLKALIFDKSSNINKVAIATINDDPKVNDYYGRYSTRVRTYGATKYYDFAKNSDANLKQFLNSSKLASVLYSKQATHITINFSKYRDDIYNIHFTVFNPCNNYMSGFGENNL